LVGGKSGSRSDGESRFFSVATEPKQRDRAYGQRHNQPSEEGERKRPDQNDVAIELVLLVEKRFLAEEGERRTAVLGCARVGNHGGVHVLLSTLPIPAAKATREWEPAKFAEKSWYDPAMWKR
jgi:hypothetical protein